MKDIKKIIYLSSILLISVNLLLAQPAQNIKQFNNWQIKGYAKNAKKMGDLYSAIDYYEYFAKINSDNLKIAFTLAELYNTAREYKKAEMWYLKTYTADPETYVLALYYYAQMLKMNGEYDKAKENFAKFKKAYKGDDVYYKKIVKFDIEGCDLAKSMMDSSLSVIITHLDTSINKAHVELSPVLLNENTLLYASLKADSIQYYDIDNKDIKIPVRRFYTAKKLNDKWTGGYPYNGPFNDSVVNTGNGAFSPDHNRFYFTHCIKNRNFKVICSIYISKKVNGKWEEPVKLDKIINNPKYTSTQPAVGTDSKRNAEVLYFVSDRIGGKGGLDIWYSVYDSKNEVFKEPKNCGNKINTIGDEVTPFYDMNTRTLYFSSNGRPNMGGYDVFKTIGELTAWLDVANIGYPLNSSVDDFYFTASNKNEGFFVSNRKESVVLKNTISNNISVISDDIYSYKYNNYIFLGVTGKIYEIRDSSIYKMLDNANKNIDEISDTAKSVKLSKGQKISLFLVDDKSKETIFIKMDSTNTNGEYFFDLERGNSYKLVLENFGLFNKQLSFSTKNLVMSDTLVMKPLWVNIVPKEPIVVKNIYYEFGEFQLSNKAKNIIDSTLLNLLIQAPQIIVEISSHTDSVGKADFNMKLSQKRAEGVVNYLISKGIAKERLIPKGYGASIPIAPNTNTGGSDNPQGRDKNRRTEFKIIGSLDQYQQINYEE